MHTYLLHMYTMFLLHVSMCFTPSSERDYIFFIKTIYILYIYYLPMNNGSVMKYKGYAYGILTL